MKVYIFICISCFSFTQCYESLDCPRYFVLPIQSKPFKTDYNLGDTLTLFADFSTNVAALNSELNPVGDFDMHGIKWLPVIRTYKIDTSIIDRDDHNSNFNNYFDVLEKIGIDEIKSYSTGGESMSGEFIEKNGKFTFEVQLHLKKKGLYYVTFNTFDIHTNDQDYPAKCGRNGFNTYFTMNDGKDNNLHLLKESPDPYWDRSRTNGYTGDVHGLEPEKHGGFCFRVK